MSKATAEKANQPYSKITQAQKDAWKKEYRGVHERVMEVDTMDPDAGTATFIFRKPRRPEIKAVAFAAKKGQDDKAEKLMFNACILGGDLQYLEDENEIDVYNGVAAVCIEMVDAQKSSIKKL